MAMLAEPRRKHKWTLNPRGKQWSEDSNKFGQKMLEKMGWTSGKGLGASEQGMTEHVKVSYKNDQSGIGFKDTGNQWTQHQTDFDDFLSQLQEQNSVLDTSTEVNKEKDVSLELKSKQSKARVHYHKFTRGKDVKKYSSKDLANIFGKRDLKEVGKAPKVEEIETEIVNEPTGSRDSTGGVVTIKGGNIDEYFKNKLPHFAKKKNSSVSVKQYGSDSEYEPKLGFGFSSAKSDDGLPPSDNNVLSNGTVSGFAFANEGLDLEYPEQDNYGKNKNSEFAYNNPCLDQGKITDSTKKCRVPYTNEGFSNPALNLNDSIDNKNSGAEFEVSRVEFGVDNSALDLSDENNKKKRVTFNEKVEYNTDSNKNKKRKTKLDKFEVENSKLKKKFKVNVATSEFNSGNDVAAGFVNEALDLEVISEEINDNELNERKTKKSKRKKNRRESNLETIVEIAEESNQLNESEVGEAVLLEESVPSKKLKKKSELVVSSELNADVSGSQVEPSKTKRREKEGKKRTEDLEDQTHQEDVSEDPVVEKKTQIKKKKAKKIMEPEIPVIVEEIPKKISKAKKNKDKKTPVIDETPSSDIQEAAIEVVVKKNIEKCSISILKEDNATITFNDASEQLNVSKSGVSKKRKSSGRENVEKSPKKSKIDNSVAREDIQDIGKDEDISTNAIPVLSSEKKGKLSKKIFKSFFAKSPILYFSGSNINEMAGYGTDVVGTER